MANKTKEVASTPKKFDPKSLNKDQQELVVEEYLGVHPKWLMPKGLNLQLNMGGFRSEGKLFDGWKFAKNKYRV